MTKNVFIFLCAILYVPSILCQFGFLPRREDGRLNTFGPVQNFLQNATGTIQAVLNIGPNREPQESRTPSVTLPGIQENNRTPSVALPDVEQNEVKHCQTEKGGSGSCIPIGQCEPYVDLQKAHCGFEGGKPMVCCPRLEMPTKLPSEKMRTEALVQTTEAPRPLVKSLTDEDYINSFPEPPVCGVSNASFTKVVGGVDAKLGDYPWIALLGYLDESLEQGVLWKCGGSLVSSKHVLTAAHCIHGHEDKLYLVRVGELDLARDDEGATPVDVLVKSKIKHEGYDSKSYVNDIGLLVLQREIRFTPLIQPICIPADSELRARSFVDYNPIIAGWGDTEFQGPRATHLQALQLPVVSNEQCANAFKQYTMQVFDERVLCAGYKHGGKDSCQGDSGGPLMQPIWNARTFTTYFYQIGMVSYGRRCAEADFPGVYTRITHFVPWLQEKMLRKV